MREIEIERNREVKLENRIMDDGGRSYREEMMYLKRNKKRKIENLKDIREYYIK